MVLAPDDGIGVLAIANTGPSSDHGLLARRVRAVVPAIRLA
jgi:hypothetical protein